MSLKIIGSGLGRTGTYSLKLALEQLGFGKCYHMAELFQHPEGLVHFQNAELGKDVDWDTLFQGYESAVDYPVARYYQHNEKVMSSVPKEKLLVFDAKQGWEPLCSFLGVAIPGTPFPNSNNREEFINRIKNIKDKIEI